MKKGSIVLFVITALVIVLCIFACTSLSKEHEEAMAVDLSGIDFNRLQDGVYKGEYAGGMYEWRYNSVEVTISDSRVVDIEVIEANEKADYNSLYNRVIEKQSLEVDAISGATLTSKAFLKSVHDALIKASM